LLIGAVALAAAGITLPVGGAALAAKWRQRQDLRTFEALEPLWNRLHDAFPQIRLPKPDGSQQDVALRLYRRVIEIDDGRLLLRPYLNEDVSAAIATAASSRGLDGEGLRATVEAAEISAALQALDGKPLKPATSPRTPDAAGPADGNFSHEATWLARVSQACATPLVRELTSRQPDLLAEHPKWITQGLHPALTFQVDLDMCDVFSGYLAWLPT
jgi:hypothetical protein